MSAVEPTRARSGISNAEWQERKVAAIARGQGNIAPVYVERAQNAELWDVEGNRYIDFGTGIAVCNTGHNQPDVVAAVREQLDPGTPLPDEAEQMVLAKMGDATRVDECGWHVNMLGSKKNDLVLWLWNQNRYFPFLQRQSLGQARGVLIFRPPGEYVMCTGSVHFRPPSLLYVWHG